MKRKYLLCVGLSWARLNCKSLDSDSKQGLLPELQNLTTVSKLADKIFSVLVADDSEADRVLLKSAVKPESRLQITAEVADGAQTIAYLKSSVSLRARKKLPFPDLLLLDLKMPRMDGFEVLQWLSVQSFGHLTVVVLTDSMQPDHIKRALDLGADLFQVKPKTIHDREAMLRALEEHLINASSKARQIIPARLRVAPRAMVGIY